MRTINTDIDAAFFYVDGIPTKGMWIELDEFSDWDYVKEELADAGFIPRNEDDEPDYGGDILVACADFLANIALGRYGCFDFDLYKEIVELSERVDSEVIIAASQLFDASELSRVCTEEYRGRFDSDKDFAYEFVEDTGMLSDVPESVAMYFDYDAFARDLMMDYSEQDGHYFANY